VVPWPVCGSDHVTSLATQRRYKGFAKSQSAALAFEVATSLRSPLS
jgi:hypothetical protein